MEASVGELRETCGHAPIPISVDEDMVEPGMNVPPSVLNECRDSFKAADERREKAGMQFFADTGLMALLCPLQSSMPMLITGHVNSFIIPGSLRASDYLMGRVVNDYGYHQQLFVLDSQVEFLQWWSLLKLGHWMARKWKICTTREAKAKAFLVDQDLPHLRATWAEQVAAQMKPSPRQVKKRGQLMVETVLALSRAVVTKEAEICKLEIELTSVTTDVLLLDQCLQASRAQLSTMKSSLSNKIAALGIEETKQLKKLHCSPYLCCCMNARALKQRLQDRLRQRKFEIEHIEHDHCKAINEQKLHKHISNALNRREPAILSLVSQYNSLCDNMKTYIKDGNAPRHAAQPVKISRQGLFSLDVDDEIWQDVGLEDDR
ncbi:hypothetical protein BU15DRAFT_76430 [Melanogaster broomeanus]|nr:hypothetical protein BU15DRAFT_76430 [Melanogaster broomeanus]